MTSTSSATTVRAFAPGRVNLIGEHTDYSGGLVLPMALDMGITVEGRRGGDRLRLFSEQVDSEVEAALPVPSDLVSTTDDWGRFPLAVAAELGLREGFDGVVRSTMPAGGTGLSSSSALTVACLLAFGALENDTVDERKALAREARRIEAVATGVQSGIMDQLISLVAVEGSATMIDCHTLDLEPVALPAGLEVVVFHSGQPRQLADSAYNARRASCEEIERRIGPLRTATVDDIATLDDPELRRRGRHVVTENGRVREMMAAFVAGDLVRCGELLDEGHRSLSTDYEVSTPVVDEVQARVSARPGVLGARMVGGGFGGALVAFCEPGADLGVDTWSIVAKPGPGASIGP